MRIATVAGVLLWLAGCNDLPPEPVSDGDQSLKSGSAGAGETDAGKADEVHNGTAEANAPGISDCELKAKSCYADGIDPMVCDQILKSCVAPAPQPPCGEDCDASVRACFAKGIDAKTCDAQYHACLDSGSGSPKAGGEPANDPYTDCVIAAKQCFADGTTPTEKCQALLDSCAVPPPPAEDTAVSCKLDFQKCYDSGTDPAECEALLQKCLAQP